MKRDDNWYVTATDRTFDNSKMVMVCPDRATARKWYDRWDSRRDLKYVNIRSTRPSYPKRQVSFYDGANDGELMQSFRSEICVAQIARDLQRMGY